MIEWNLPSLELNRHSSHINLVDDEANDSNLNDEGDHDPDRTIEVYFVFIFEKLRFGTEGPDCFT